VATIAALEGEGWPGPSSREQRTYRTFTAQQKLEIVLAGLRGDVTVKELCRSHEIAETLYYSWREKLRVNRTGLYRTPSV
jgi:transposase-like protein